VPDLAFEGSREGGEEPGGIVRAGQDDVGGGSDLIGHPVPAGHRDG